MRLLEMLTDRFGVFRGAGTLHHQAQPLHQRRRALDGPAVAEAVLEFADDLRTARAASGAWAETNGLVHHRNLADSEDDA